MIKFLIALMLITSPLYAEKFGVEKPDGSVAIVNYVTGSQDSKDDVLRDAGLSGTVFEPGATPGRSDRKYWKRSGSSIVVDSVKKQQDLDAKALKEAEKEGVLAKLKISKEEYEKLNALEK